MFGILGKQKISLTHSITTAVESTRVMVEALAGRDLTLKWFSIQAEKFKNKSSEPTDKVGRLINTHCEFVDKFDKTYDVVAWVVVNRVHFKWVPDVELNFIRMPLERIGIRMRYTTPTTKWPGIPLPVKAPDFEPTTMPREWNPHLFDYSAIH